MIPQLCQRLIHAFIYNATPHSSAPVDLHSGQRASYLVRIPPALSLTLTVAHTHTTQTQLNANQPIQLTPHICKTQIKSFPDFKFK